MPTRVKNRKPEFAVFGFNFTLCEIKPVKIGNVCSRHKGKYLKKQHPLKIDKYMKLRAIGHHRTLL